MTTHDHFPVSCVHGNITLSCRCKGDLRGATVPCESSFCDVDPVAHENDRVFDPQPDPIANDEPHSVDIAIEFLRERKEFGIQKYGTALQPFNGRDSLSDAIDEAADLLVYLINARAERDAGSIEAES